MGRSRRRTSVSASALVTIPAAVTALLIVVPAPHPYLWIGGVLAREFSLVVSLLAVIGLVLAGLAARAGARWPVWLLVGAAAVSLVVGMAPVASAGRTARALGVDLSYTGYAAGLSYVASREPDAAVRYASPGGHDLLVDVWRARTGDGPRPAVVLVHGGAWTGGRRSGTPRWDTWLADTGFTVFDIDYRLAPPPSWRSAPGDVRCAIGWVKRNAAVYRVDPRRVVVMGMSAGGHLALLAAYVAGDATGAGALPPSCGTGDTTVRAVVSLYGPADLAYSYTLPTPWWTSGSFADTNLRALRAFTGGTPESARDAYLVASPTNYVRVDVPPTLLIQGGRDQLQPPADSRRLARKLAETGATHRYVEISYADHGFDASWGGFASQITRASITRFIHDIAI